MKRLIHTTAIRIRTQTFDRVRCFYLIVIACIFSLTDQLMRHKVPILEAHKCARRSATPGAFSSEDLDARAQRFDIAGPSRRPGNTGGLSAQFR